MIKIKKTTKPLKSSIASVLDCKSAVFIQTNGAKGEHYYFLIDFLESTISCWEVDVSEAKSSIQKQVMEKMNVEWKGYAINYLNFSLMPHTAIAIGRYIYITLINGNFIIQLDRYSDQYHIIYNDKEPFEYYSSTNSYYNDELYFSKYNLFEKIETLMDPQISITNTLAKYNVKTRKFTNISSFSERLTMHQTAVANYGSNIISVGICTSPKIPIPEDSHFNDPNFMKHVLEEGLNESCLINYDVQTETYRRFTTTDCIAHIEFDLTNPDISYVSSHNLGYYGSEFGNDIMSFGPGAVYKYDYRKHEILTRYTSEDFFRITSHIPYQYQNKNYLAATVFPNQIHILNTDTMKLVKQIFVSKSNTQVDFSSGPYMFPKIGKTPYMVLPVTGKPYFFYGGLSGLKIYNFVEDQILGTINYNLWGKPLTAIGHPIIFESDQPLGR